MGFLDMFRKSAAPADPSLQPSAIDYVDWLLQHMLRTSNTTLTLGTRRPLPGQGSAKEDTPPPCTPEVQTVINRLKVMSGVQPVRHEQPVEGSFEQPRTQLVMIVDTRFHDGADESTCTIRLRFKDKQT